MGPRCRCRHSGRGFGRLTARLEPGPVGLDSEVRVTFPRPERRPYGAGSGRPRPPIPRPEFPKWGKPVAIGIAILVVLIIIVGIFVSIDTEHLWFDSVGYGKVFTTRLVTRIWLFVGFGLFAAAAMFRQRLPRLPGSAGVSRLVARAARARSLPHGGRAPTQVGLRRNRRAVRPDFRFGRLRPLANLAAVEQRDVVRSQRSAVPQGRLVLRVHLPVPALRARLRHGARR